jgi:glycosyltransferase involved in cell wall biosynthesis
MSISRPLRIGIDGRGIYKTIDGIGRYSLNLIRSLASIDQTNQYIIFKNKEIREKIVDVPNFQEIEIDFRHLSMRSLIYLPLLIKKYNLDVFHSPFFIAPLWGVKNLIVTVHDLMALTFPGFFGGRGYLKQKVAYWYHRIFVPLSIKKAKKIIAVSQSTKMDLINYLHIDSERISVIYEAVDDYFKKPHTADELGKFKKNKGLPANYFLYTGNMKPYKNINLMISALAILKNKGVLKHKLLMAGRKDRFFPIVYKEVKDKNLSDDVVFLDYVSDEELPLLIKCADIFIFPSLYEGFGLPALEAMSLGVPTIVSNASSLPEVVSDGAIIIDSHDPQDLAQAVVSLLKDEDLRKNLSKRGIERSKVFSWRKAAEETLEVYLKVYREQQVT